MTWEEHKLKWKTCTLCDLCQTRRKVVLGRGSLPAHVLISGEAPGDCITGDSLIETAWRDKSVYPNGIPIKDLVGKTDFQVYSYDLLTRKLVLGLAKRVWRVGVKKTYLVSYFWWGGKEDGSGGRQKYTGSIRVTNNHPFLLKSGEYLSLNGGLKVGDRLQPFYRNTIKERGFVGLTSKTLTRESRLLYSSKLGRELAVDEEVHHADRNKQNDSYDNLELLTKVEHARLHGIEDNTMYDPVHKATHKAAMASEEYRSGQSTKMKEFLSKPDAYLARLEQINRDKSRIAATVKNKFATDPVYYYSYLRGRQSCTSMTDARVELKFKEKFPNIEFPPTENHEIYAIKECKNEIVYDMEVENYHNFVANGVFVHNSEDVSGKPFWGPAGVWLQDMIGRTLEKMGVSYFITNLTGCVPKDDANNKTGAPEEYSIKACAPRLTEVIELCQPRAVVCVGDLSKKWLPKMHTDLLSKVGTVNGNPIKLFNMLHPAYIMRLDVTQQPLMIKRGIATLQEAGLWAKK